MPSNKYAVIVDAEQKFIAGLGQIVGGQMKFGEPFKGCDHVPFFGMRSPTVESLSQTSFNMTVLMEELRKAGVHLLAIDGKEALPESSRTELQRPVQRALRISELVP